MSADAAGRSWATLGPHMRKLIIDISATLTSRRAKSLSAGKSASPAEPFQHFGEIAERIAQPGSLQIDMRDAYDEAKRVVNLLRTASDAKRLFKNLDEEHLAEYLLAEFKKTRAAHAEKLKAAVQK